MRLYIALTGVALAIAAVCGAPLAWDGSYYLVKVLDTQGLWMPHNRLSNILLQWPVLLASHVTDNLAILRLTFALPYLATPLVAVAAGWWIVRRPSPDLFVWAALGIGLGTLPGQFNMNSEDLQAVQLFWPVLLATLVGLPRRTLVVVAPLLVYILVAHPIASVLCLLGAGAAVIVGLRERTARRIMLMWAVMLVALAVARYAIGRDSYEANALTLSTLVHGFEVSLIGVPLVALSCAWSAAIVTAMTDGRKGEWGGHGRLTPPQIRACVTMVGGAALLILGAHTARTPRDWVALSLAPPLGAAGILIARCIRPARRYEPAVPLFYGIVGVALVGCLLVPWGWDPVAWSSAIDFRDWVLPSSLPFMLLAIGEGAHDNRHRSDLSGRMALHRMRMIQGAGVVFLAVLVAQSISLARLTGVLRRDMEARSTPCIVASSMPGLGGTPLGHWSIASFALLQQSRSPMKLVLQGDGCAEFSRSGLVRITTWDATLGSGWFDLRWVRTRAA